MTRNSSIARPLLTLAVTLVSIPLAAKEPVVVTGERGRLVYQDRVDFADLDLRERQARTVLVRRVMTAAWSVCIAAEGRRSAEMALGGADGNCPNSTYRAAQPQIRVAIERAKSGQPQLATALVISGPARTH
jgi:UrcA family protein